MTMKNIKKTFTVQEIETAHQKVKSGAEFPSYIQEIIALGVCSFQTFVTDSHTQYYGENGYQVASRPQYLPLRIAEKSDAEAFHNFLKHHQQGGCDYFTFCKYCAETGVDNWVVNINEMTCTYYDKDHKEVLVELIPS